MEFNQILQNLDETIQNLVASDAKHIDEYNALCDVAEQLESELIVTKNTLKTVRDQEAANHTRLLDLKNSSTAVAATVSTVNAEITKLRKEMKPLKEQVKRLKESNSKILALSAKKDKEITKLKADNGKCTELICIYSVGGEELYIDPKRKAISVKGEPTSAQTVLLYTDGRGCYTSMGLDQDSSIFHSAYLNESNTLTALQVTKFNANCMQPTMTASDFAQQWLIRVNKKQSGDTYSPDRMCYLG